MPRGGPPTNTYTLPAVYLAIPGTTILATQHNSPLEDIADVLNDPWPTNIGGTGGTSIITSYDSLNSRGTDVPTSATIDLDAVTGPNIHLTGAVTATAVSLSNGRVRTAVADSAFLITAGASLVVNGYTSGNVAVPAGTVLTFVGSTAGIVYVAFSDSGAASFVGYTTTATAAGTTTLTAASTYQQYFTGATTQTVVLPVTSTLNLGSGFRIVNNSTGIVTVNSSGANAVVAMQPATQAIVTCILTSGTTAASWSITYIPVTSNANSNTILVADGTVSLPAYSFKSDPNTGIYSIGADNIGIAANGAKVVDIATTGVAVTGTLSSTGNLSTSAGNLTVTAGTGSISSTAAGTLLTVTSTDAGATSGPDIDLYRFSASPAVNDVLSKIIWNGQDSGPAKQEYASIQVTIVDPTSASEDAVSEDYVTVGGTRTAFLRRGALASGTASPTAVGLPLGQLSFPATQNSSADVNTLDDYEEGSWTATDASGAGLSITTVVARYIKIGKLVYASFRLTYPATASGATAQIGGLPYTSLTAGVALSVGSVSTTAATPNGIVNALLASAGTSFSMVNNAGGQPTNVIFTGATVYGSIQYEAST